MTLLHACHLRRYASTALFAIASAVLVAAPPTHAEQVQVTYGLSASGFEDSNGNSPDSPTTSSIDSVFTFTFDTAMSQQISVMPDAITGLLITDNNGTTITYDTGDAGVNTAVNVFQGSARITFGGTINGVASMSGLSNDFRVTFDLSLDDFSVTNVFENLVFVTVADPFFNAQSTTVTLIDAIVLSDADDDGVVDGADNCIFVANAGQRDTDGDGIGNWCDADFNQDCVINASDLVTLRLNFFATGDLETDLDGDGVTNAADLSLLRAMFFSAPGPSGVPNVCSF